MGEVIDINRQLAWKRMANILADGGQIVCHPSNHELLNQLEGLPITTSNLVPEGKAYAVDFKAMHKAMMDMLNPKSMVIGIDWAKE